MAKAAAIFAVVAFCAFVAEGHTSGTKARNASITPPYSTSFHPQPSPEFLGIMMVCDEEILKTPDYQNCQKFIIRDHGCHNIPKIHDKWNDLARAVFTEQCVHLFEHSGCQGQRITVGHECYNTGCCPHPHFLSKCNFANKLTSYMIC